MDKINKNALFHISTLESLMDCPKQQVQAFKCPICGNKAYATKDKNGYPSSHCANCNNSVQIKKTI